jgi:hypothetical protein
MADEFEQEVEQPIQEEVNSEVEQQEPVQAQDAQPEPVEEETTASSEDTNTDTQPKDNAEWAKRRIENKRLKEAVNRSEVDQTYLDKLLGVTSPDVYSNQSQQVKFTEDTDLDTVNKTVNYALAEAASAKAEANRNRRETEDMIAEQAYPELKSDPLFQQLVAEKRLSSEVLGHRRRTIDICREVDTLLSQRDQRAAAQAEVKTQQRMVNKQTATAEVNTSSSQGRSTFNQNELRQRIHRGDRDALSESIKNTILADIDIT